MKIAKRDKNVDFYSSLYERENPGKLRAKRSSNTVFLVCASLAGVMLIIYVLRWNTLLGIETETKENIAYATDANNIKLHEEKLKIQAKIKEIEDYNKASETFLAQLAKSERFSVQWMEFFEKEMQNSIGSGNTIEKYEFSDNLVKLTCRATSPDKPKLYVQHLVEMKNEEGNNKFPKVAYSGFSETENIYEFKVEISLWALPEIETE